jgi:hypothetical protein
MTPDHEPYEWMRLSVSSRRWSAWLDMAVEIEEAWQPDRLPYNRARVAGGMWINGTPTYVWGWLRGLAYYHENLRTRETEKVPF